MEINIQTEFDRQVQNLIDKGYPKLLGESTEAFAMLLKPLETKLPLKGNVLLEDGKLPFVIVIKSPNKESEKLMSLVTFQDKPGLSKMYPHTTKDFHPTEHVRIPESIAYVLIDIDRGKASLNIPPDAALQTILAEERSPLTIDEGIALITHFPDFLLKNNCFSLLGSRCAGNKRVPAIWINGQKQANLGWCWDGNPHTWLGSASCAERRG